MNPATSLDFAAANLSWPVVTELLRPLPERTVPRKVANERSTDLLAWGKKYLPAHFSLPPSAMHRRLAAWLDRMNAERRLKLNVLGPRGSAKSTLVTLAFTLRAALPTPMGFVRVAFRLLHLANFPLSPRSNEGPTSWT
jgi:hypothetical protein